MITIVRSSSVIIPGVDGTDDLGCGRRRFLRKGFHGVGVDELGNALAWTGPTSLPSFSSKDEILAALFNEAMDELVSATAMVHDEPMADLARLIRHHVGYAVSQRQLVNVYQREDRR